MVEQLTVNQLVVGSNPPPGAIKSTEPKALFFVLCYNIYMSKVKYISKILFFILLILFGIFIFIYGGYDDSPGAQGLGLFLFVFSLIKLIKLIRKK